MPKLEKGYKANYKTLLRAAKADRLALLDCQDKATGKPVRVIAAVNVNPNGGEETFQFVPIAKLFDGNPYEELNPPGYDL